MKLPNFTNFEPLNQLKDQMGIPRDSYGSFPQVSEQASPSGAALPRAFILLKSGGRLDLLHPQPDAWTDEDLAIGLSRTYRWGGYSKWDLPLSVAQHSLTVLALREAEGPLTAREALQELLHDATEALFGGFDPIAPLKPHLGPAFASLDSRLQVAVDQRYRLPAWTEDSYARHKHADRLAAASEAYHVVGWTRDEMRSSLEISLDPLGEDPLVAPADIKPWEPWPPRTAMTLFFNRLTQLLDRAKVDDSLADLAKRFSLLPPQTRSRYNHWPSGSSLTDTLVYVEADDGSQSLEGVIVDGQRDEDGAFDIENIFTVFTTHSNADGELILCNGANCHVEIL
ncbi:hypothetical protein [Methylocapsa aurea]|uniref:hypothetical protein n=1 Tax=Methylocapsa aurea TaxID=663610 RepID=UPI00192E443C|nr:hypothetical protein [Methylocapsa aurea]